MASFLPVLNSRKNKDGTYALFILVTTYYQRKKINTKIRIHPKNWNENKREVRSNHKDYFLLNEAIRAIIERLARINAELIIRNEEPSAALIRDVYNGKHISNKSFSDFADKKIKELEAPGKRAEMLGYKTMLDDFHAFAGNGVHFNMLTVSRISGFRDYLANKGNGINTQTKKLERLRRLIRDAITEGYMSQDKYPFFNFKMRKIKTTKDKLTPEEISLIEKAKLTPGSYIDRSRDCFILQYYLAGMRIGDVLQLKHSDIKEGRVVYAMSKTSKPMNIKIHPKAAAIIKKYHSPGRIYVLPFYDNNFELLDDKAQRSFKGAKTTLINKGLSEIAAKLEIKKKVSTHVSRHSFGYKAKLNGVDNSTLKDLFGHSTEKTTNIYVGSLMFDDKMDQAMDDVLGE